MRRKNKTRVYSAKIRTGTLNDQYSAKYSDVCKGLTKNPQTSLRSHSNSSRSLYNTRDKKSEPSFPRKDDLKSSDINAQSEDQKLHKLSKEFNLSSLISRSFFE